MSDQMWNLRDATAFIIKLEPFLEKIGYHFGLTGGVLFRGKSKKDLDVIVYPHNKGPKQPDADSIWDAIKSFCKPEDDAVCQGGTSQIRDAKDVRWLKARGKRIDFFFLD